MQDNSHSPKMTIVYLIKRKGFKDIKLMKSHRVSLDINPIKNVWMKTKFLWETDVNNVVVTL